MSHLGAVAHHERSLQLLDFEVVQVRQVLLGTVQLSLQLVQARLCGSQLHGQEAAAV